MPAAASLRSRRGKTPWMLLIGATFVALLAGAFAGLFGGLVALLVVLFLFLSFYAMVDYRFGVLGAMFLVPISASRIMPHELFGLKGMNPLNVLIVAALFSLLMTRPFMRVPLRIPSPPRMFWVFVGMMVFSALHGAMNISKIPGYYQLLQIVSFDGASGYLRDVLIKPLLSLTLAFMVGLTVANAKKPGRVLLPFFLSSLMLPVMVLALVAMSGMSLTSLSGANKRNFLSQLGLHANELGLLFNTTFALGLFVLFELRSLLARWLMVGMLGLVAVAIVLTFSRGALLGLVVVVMYFLFTVRRFHLMAGVLALGLVAALLMPKAVVERASSGVAAGNVSEISAGRVSSIWLPLLPEVVTSPAIGHGMSSILWSDAARLRLILPVGHPHSAYLGVLLDFGLIGAILIFLFYRDMWRMFGRLAREEDDPAWRGFFRGAMACILLLMVQGVTDDRFTPTAPQIYLWLSYGLALGMMARKAPVQPALAAQR